MVELRAITEENFIDAFKLEYNSTESLWSGCPAHKEKPSEEMLDNGNIFDKIYLHKT